MHIFGILLFIALIVADIVRIFKDDDEFDGIMLFARPIVVFVGALLCDGTFWQALLWAVGWGVVGFIIAVLISEHFGNSYDSSYELTSQKTKSTAQSDSANTGVKYTRPADNATPQKPQSSVVPLQPSGSFEFAFNVLPEQDARYNKARASNGVVYYRFSSGESPIGHYELTDGGTRVNIYRTSDKGLIGYAIGDEIYISRKAQYDRECKVRDEHGYSYYIKVPIPMELNLAEIRNGAIKDNRSYEYLGYYQGDKYAAAAVFVSLIYECHSEYEYHPFFMNWDK